MSLFKQKTPTTKTNTHKFVSCSFSNIRFNSSCFAGFDTELFLMSDFFFVIRSYMLIKFDFLYYFFLLLSWCLFLDFLSELFVKIIQLETVGKCFLPRITGKAYRFCFCHIFSRLSFF